MSGEVTNTERWSVTLASTPVSVTEARHLVTRTLEQWRRPVGPDVELVVSELVSNAVIHATLLGLSVVADGPVLRIEVHDTSHSVPQRHPPEGVNGGYGLNMVATLAQNWGWVQTSTGKTVWAELQP